MIQKQAKRIKTLQQRDAYHDGPNIPPSKNTITQMQNKKKRSKNRRPSGKKPGGQSGHKGLQTSASQTRLRT